MSTAPVHKQWSRVLAKSIAISVTQLYDWSLISSAVEIIEEERQGHHDWSRSHASQATYKGLRQLAWIGFAEAGIDEAV
jgi:hypothetical protein